MHPCAFIDQAHERQRQRGRLSISVDEQNGVL